MNSPWNSLWTLHVTGVLQNDTSKYFKKAETSVELRVATDLYQHELNGPNLESREKGGVLTMFSLLRLAYCIVDSRRRRRTFIALRGGTNPDPGEHIRYSNSYVDLQLQSAIGDFPD